MCEKEIEREEEVVSEKGQRERGERGRQREEEKKKLVKEGGRRTVRNKNRDI